MLDIKLIREKPDFVKQELAKVGAQPEAIDHLLELDGRSEQERESRRAQMRELSDTIAQGERELAALEQEVEAAMLELPNLPRPYVPVGSGEQDNRVVRSEFEPRKFDFEPRPHWEIAQRLGIIDFERG